MGDVSKIYFRAQSFSKHDYLRSKQQPTADKSAEAQQADRVPLSNENRAEKSARLKCDIVADYRTKEGARTVAAGLSSASRENVQKNRGFGRLVENRCQTRLSRYFSNDIPKLHSNSAHSTSADNTATPPPTDRVPLSNENRAEKSARLKCG